MFRDGAPSRASLVPRCVRLVATYAAGRTGLLTLLDHGCRLRRRAAMVAADGPGRGSESWSTPPRRTRPSSPTRPPGPPRRRVQDRPYVPVQARRRA
ncbi:hypothetical protein [Streptomyces shaanxiensis]